MENKMRFAAPEQGESFPAKVSEVEQRDTDMEREPFDAERAVDYEKNVLGQQKDGSTWKGKAGKMVKIFTLISSLALPMGKVDEAQAFEGKGTDAQKIEMTADRQQAADVFINILRKLPDNPMAVSPAHNEMLKKRAAKILIDRYALESVGGSLGSIPRSVNTNDRSKACKELRSVLNSSDELSDEERKFLSSVL